MEAYYVILSSGAYSDYSPVYFVGPTKVTQEELKTKSLEIGDAMWAYFESLPERNGEFGSHRYDPETNDYVGICPDEGEFIEKMSEWLYSIGYQKLPSDIPEINVYYDVPRTELVT